MHRWLRQPLPASLLILSLAGLGQAGAGSAAAQSARLPPPPPLPSPSPAPVEPEQLEAILSEWLYCVECARLPLETLLATVPITQRDQLAERINCLIRSAPDCKQDENLLVEHLKKNYHALKAYQSTHPEVELASSNDDEYVDLYLTRSRYHLQRRGVITLDALRTPRAFRTLRELQGAPLKPALEPSTKSLLNQIVATLPP